MGRAVSQHCLDLGDEVLSYNHQTLDIASREQVSAVMRETKPEAVINCAAWTDVDGCETDSVRAYATNAAGPGNLANASRKVGAVFVTISTDYVFDGTKEGFYTQRDDPNPESVYGRAKLEGERVAQAAHARTIIVRTGFVFGPGGKNFLSTVVERACRGERVRAISDSWGTPTYAPHLARRLRELALIDLPGVFHVTNFGEGASYEDFARVALRAAECDTVSLETLSMDSLQRPAPRPRNSRLKCLLSEAMGLAPLPFWQDALLDFVASPRKTVIVAHS